MEPQAAAMRVIDGICQQVVKVDEQSSQHDQIRIQPLFPKKNCRHNPRNNEMQCYV